ncbi:MAG: chloride channel protein [Candidatus Nanopelagicales bacterium]
MTTTAAARRPIPAMLLAAVISLVLGYFVLEIVNAGIILIWETIPESWASTPAWYVLGILLIAAVLVFVIRTFVGDSGHSPIGGIKVSAVTPKEYVGVILAILASLWGGIVLGPEVALVATGSMIGGLVAKRMRFTDAKDQKKVVGFGALGAILALFVGPIISGSMQLGSTPEAIEVDQLGWAIVVALIVAVVVTLSRTVAALIARAAGGGPHLPILVAAALIVGISALIVQSRTGEGILFIVTSGEEFITKLPELTTVSTVIAIIIFKAIAYAVSLGSGFRGGPFFPAMFVGAATGLLISLAMGDSGPSVPAAIVVGVIASLIATAPMKWPIVILLGVVLGLMMGTWTLVPAALVGAVVARLIPRWGDRIVPRAEPTVH